MTAPTRVDAGRSAPRTFDRKLLAPMMLGAILNPINTSIIAVALVPIAAGLGAAASQTACLVSALYLATSIGQPLVGRLVDTFGPRRLFLAGAALTGIAGILGTLAPNIGVLIVARVVLGFGTCAGYPASMYLIRSEAKRTGHNSPAGVLTALAVATQTTVAIGPTIGGLLIGLEGWRATFAVNIPLSAAGLVLGALFLPKETPTRVPGRRLDHPGITLFAATLVALLLYLMNASIALLWLLAIAVLAATGFTLRELRCADPFIDVRVFAGNLPLLATYGRTVFAQIVSYSFIYGFTQWLEDGRGLSASAAGLILLPTFAIGILVSMATGRRPQVRGKLIVGAVSQLIACVLLLVVHAHAAVWFLVLIAIVLGVPQGLNSLANQNALYHQANPERMGASAGLMRTFAYLGAIIASAASGSFFGTRADTTGLHELATFMLVVAAIFVAMALFDRSLARIGRNNSQAADLSGDASVTP
jgi:MFS family permease